MATVIIAEKPSSAQKIAQALAGGSIQAKAVGGASFYCLSRGGKEIIVAPAVGHLFVLREEKRSSNWTYPVFGVEWRPVFQQSKASAWSKKYYQNLKRLAPQAGEIISACDYDVEGSTIAWNIMRFIFHASDGRRMKFSTLTKQDLIEAYENASPHLDFEQIEAGLARHHLDFLWGINASRALTHSLKEGGTFRVLSTGRVQGPTLHLLEQREKAIRAFVPTPFWELHLTAVVNGREVAASHATGKFWKKEQAERILGTCKGKDGSVTGVETKQYQQPPPPPFDLTTLQREAYQHFGFSPKQTLDIAQSLYEQALISYPRTSSQKLPEKIGFASILESLAAQKDYQPLCRQLLGKPLRPHEGEKSDPAHPAIYPTGALPKELNPYEKRLYDLVVRRFLATFGLPALRERARGVITVEGEPFVAEGLRTIQPNWIALYQPYAAFREVILPPLKEGDPAAAERLEMLDKQTSPPPRFTQATVLRDMEKLGLGTKATRAGILQTLYDRGYIEEKSIVVTRLGESVISALESYCPEIVSPDLTRQFEEEMQAIQANARKRDAVVQEAEKTLSRILASFKAHQKEIGEVLFAGLQEVRRLESTIGPCSCGGTLVKRRSRAGKPFVGCLRYPDCTQTFSLPHAGLAKPLTQTCDCGLFILSVRQPRKRPWKLCVRCGFKSDAKKPADEAPASTGQE